jgi:hypothetical protein
MITQQLFLIGMILIGGYVGMWFRRFEMSGLEMYLTFGLLTAYAISPFWGVVVGSSMMMISLVLYPRGLERFWIPIVVMAATFYLGVRFFPINQHNFVFNSIVLVLAYNIGSNLLYIVTGYDWFRAFRFIMLSFFLNFLVLSRFGWDLVLWLGG